MTDGIQSLRAANGQEDSSNVFIRCDLLRRKACVCHATTLSLLQSTELRHLCACPFRSHGLGVGVNLPLASTKDSAPGSVLSSLGPGSLMFFEAEGLSTTCCHLGHQ